ncbi:MAG: hypothetical protein R2748_00915 [Bryobacterales bacterium]
MAIPTDLPMRAFASQQNWEDWLVGNCRQAPGLWLQIAKKASGIASVTYDEALEVALCFGWIDGLKKTFDERFFIQRFTPAATAQQVVAAQRGHRGAPDQAEEDAAVRPARGRTGEGGRTLGLTLFWAKGRGAAS